MFIQSIPPNSLPPMRVTNSAIRGLRRGNPDRSNIRSLVRLAYRSHRWFYIGGSTDDESPEDYLISSRENTEYALAVDDYGEEWVMVFRPDPQTSGQLIMTTAFQRFVIPFWLMESVKSNIERVNNRIKEENEELEAGEDPESLWEVPSEEELRELARMTLHMSHQLSAEDAEEMTDKVTSPSCGTPFISPDSNWVFYFCEKKRQVRKIRPVLFEL